MLKRQSDQIFRMVPAAITVVAGLAAAVPGEATELNYGLMLQSNHGVTTRALVPLFEAVRKATGGEVTFRLLADSTVVTMRTASDGISKGLVDAGLIVPIYARKTFAHGNVMFDMQVFGPDPISVAGAALETTMLRCPECLDDFRKANQVFLSNYATAPFKVMCKDEIKGSKSLAGRRIRVSGGSARFAKAVGAVPINMPPEDGVQAMERGAVDCVIGAVSWLTGYGYIDVVKHVADYSLGSVGFVALVSFNRDSWNKLSAENRKKIFNLQPLASARATIDGYIAEDEEVKQKAVARGIKFYPVDFSEAMKKYQAEEMESIPTLSKRMGVADPEKIMNTYIELIRKWDGIIAKSGRDSDSFARELQTRIYSKIDIGKL